VKKAGIPKGTRDYDPAVMARRRYIFRTIEDIFQLFGYQPIETPAMENLDTLLGKYGDEGDKLLFRILNSGDYLSGLDRKSLEQEDPGRLSSMICGKGLRYDLTVPFARYVVQHRNDITFPFKRYQIQPVWRADRPQKGRYREFYQCDVDIIGSNSILNEVELIQIIDRVFSALGLDIQVKVNNRKILAGIAEALDESERMMDITIALDKLDKIGEDKVLGELRDKGLKEGSLTKLRPILGISGDFASRMSALKKILAKSEAGQAGITEMESLFGYLADLDLEADVEVDLSLARGLNYYTGAIIEVLSKEVEIGSICGGGRYDDLTGIFGLEDVSGVGISFGADRIFDVMEQLDRFPDEATTGTRILFVNFGTAEASAILSMLPQFRNAGIQAELYPDPVKLKKQLSYANNRSIPFVGIIGVNEMLNNVITLKDMISGEQKEVTVEEAIREIG